MITLTLLIKGLLLGWFLVDFQPLQELIRRMNNKISDKYFIVMYLKGSLSCQKCLTFWITLGLTGNIFIAILAAFIVKVLKSK